MKSARDKKDKEDMEALRAEVGCGGVEKDKNTWTSSELRWVGRAEGEGWGICC